MTPGGPLEEIIHVFVGGFVSRFWGPEPPAQVRRATEEKMVQRRLRSEGAERPALQNGACF